MTAPRIWLACALLLTLAATPSFGVERAIGSVKTVTGSAFVVRGGDAFPAQVGERLFEADRLRVGADGSLGAILKDDTLLSLGPGSEVVLDRFVFSPTEGKLEFVLRLVKGALVYVSGQIAKLSPDTVRVETPIATIGIRGTRFAAHVQGE